MSDGAPEFAGSRCGITTKMDDDLTSKFLVPSAVSLVRTFFIMTASSAASDGLFLGCAKVPAGEVPLPLDKLPVEVDKDIPPCNNNSMKIMNHQTKTWKSGYTKRLVRRKFGGK